MSEEEKTVLAKILGAISPLSSTLEAAFRSTVSKLIGGAVDIPAALMRRKTQEIDDLTRDRSAVSAGLAKGVLDRALQDEDVMRAAAEILMPVEIRKAQNRVQVAERAAEHIVNAADDPLTPEPPGDDWMNKFGRYAEDASSEELQDLFARILAGEVMKPRSFSLATLRAVAEMDQETAKDFTLVWSRSVGVAVDNDPLFHLGEWFSRWKRLAESGLMAPDVSAQYTPDFNPAFGKFAPWSPMLVEGAVTLAYFPEGTNAKWEQITFTRIGREIGSILPRPDYAQNMRIAGRRLGAKYGLKVDLHIGGEVESLTNAK